MATKKNPIARMAHPLTELLHGHEEQSEPVAESLRRNHEAGDMRVRPVLYFALSLLILLVLVFPAFWGLFKIYKNLAESDNTTSAFALTPVVPSGPRLEPNPTDPRNSWEVTSDFKKGELEILESESAQWIDQGAGKVRIPLQRAITLLLERGELESEPAENVPSFVPQNLESEGGFTEGLPTPPPVGEVLPTPTAQPEASPEGEGENGGTATTPEATGTAAPTRRPAATATPGTRATATPATGATPTPTP